uniref:Leucine rich repeat protein, putative n=1 Tax=Toxoplasma gondii (strain ATCC 50861 / VEG) TaxID=432359 RepID=A0A0F7V7B1_TOXGV|nr:TPA: leucine rich repeat protein, putative [Toxoplasma gondii VEG]
MGITSQITLTCRRQSASLVRGNCLGFRPSTATCCKKHVFFVPGRRVICATGNLCCLPTKSFVRLRIHRRYERFETRLSKKTLHTCKASLAQVLSAPLAEFVENDCAGIGKVPVRLIKDAVQLKEEHEKTVAAAQAQTQADVAAAGHLVPTSHFGSQGRGNHSAGGTRGKAGKTASETSSEGGHSAGGNRGCLARKAAGGVVSSTTGTVPSPSVGSVAKEKTVAGLGILPAKDGASGLTQGMPLASPSPDMTAAQVLDWVLHRPWVERDEHLIEQALEKFYVDAQTRLTQGKPAEATKMATLAIRLSRILDERQAAKARAVADNPSTMRMFKERKMDLFW